MDEYFGAQGGPGAFGSSARGFPGNVFLGSKGIRAGWRLLLFLTIFIALWAASIFALGMILRPAPDVF